MRSIVSAILCALLILVSQAGARQLYVALNGSNSNPGTIDQPWRTIAYAVSASSGVHAGDTIVVRNGNYPESVYPGVSGTAAQPIVMGRLKYETVTLDPGEIRFDSGISYWKLWGLTIRHSSGSGIEITGTHSTDSFVFQRCTLSHNKEDGIYLSGGFGGVSVLSCDIEYNGELNGVPQAAEGHGIVVYGGGPGKLTAVGNMISNNWHKGLAYGSPVQFSGDNSQVSYNMIINNYESGCDFSPDNSLVSHNFISYNGQRDTESGEFGDKGLMPTPYCYHTTIAFNLCKSNGGNEIAPLGDHCYYYNNTLYKDVPYTAVAGSTMQGAMTFYTNDPPGSVFRNNIICNMLSKSNHHWAVIAETYTTYAGDTWSNNLYWTPNSVDPAPYNKPFKLYGAPGPGGTTKTLAEVQATWPNEETNSLYVAPGFVDVADSNFNLLSNSPAIDAGTNVGFPYVGQAPDIGAFEFGAATSGGPIAGLFQNSGAALSLKGVGGDEVDLAVDPATGVVTRDYGNGANPGTAVPGAISLEQNSPNPFNPTTAIHFTLPNAANVKLAVYTITGQLIQTLVEGNLEAGAHEAIFDGSHLASGVYLYRLDAGSFSQTQKMILAK